MSDRQNPRVNLTIPPDLLEVIKRYSEINKKTPSRMIRELLVELRPTFEMTIEAYDQAQKGKLDVVQNLQSEAMGVVGKALEDLSNVGKKTND